MKELNTILREVYDSIPLLDDEEFIQNSCKLLDGYSRSAVLETIFLEFQSSLSRAVLLNLGFWFEKIKYEDILKAMLRLGRTNLSAYHFAIYIPEIFGVNVKKAASEIQQKFPEEKDSVAYFTSLSQTHGPSRHATEKLKEFGASPERIRENLRKSGAPLLPFQECI